MDKDLKPCDIYLLKQSISEQLNEGDGFWMSCSGCHELNEGYDTGRYSDIFKCALGIGCSECGGIGAVWDNTDYEAMATHMMEQDNTRATDCREVDVEELKREVPAYLAKKYRLTGQISEATKDIIFETLDYLASRNLIRGAVEPIEGLDVAINVLEDDLVLTKQERVWFDIVIEAAKSYHAKTKGE